ncbi:diguanylate cyclase domain-containing protein [Marinibacterium sp. SX1]|uniref:diguanylate cyclase domain-containing protein n=1 Tax=Marinibacterium sp. SX1 TaxID=3388424 RepID=UPI003D16EA3F
MQGRLLILDAVSTNRIVLTALLEPACYTVDQGQTLADALVALRIDRPDLVLTAWSLPDGSAMDLRAALDAEDPDRLVPVVAIARPGELTDRRAALRAGLTDLLVHPLDETMLQARLRAILRARPAGPALDLGPDPDNHGRPPDPPRTWPETAPDTSARAAGAPHAAPGFAEPRPGFARPGRVAILADEPETAHAWCQGLSAQLNQPVSGFGMMQRGQVLNAVHPPDVVVLALTADRPGPALRCLADLRAGPSTRHMAVIALPRGRDGVASAAVQALDMGADDVMPGPFEPGELALRVQAQLRRKHLSDRLRNTVRDGLRAALIDPMTGLYNRRYALPHLAHVIRQSARTGRSFAVMMADLDHFKRINDQHGHLAGDAVLTEAAGRLRAALDPQHVLARIGGEEFLVVLRDTDAPTARAVADALRRAVDARPFPVGDAPDGQLRKEAVTVSIGVAICPPAGDPDVYGFPDDPDEPRLAALLQQADRALYTSKNAGRNTVTIARSAA